MPNMALVCDYCGKPYHSYQCGKRNHFCSIECRRKGAKLMSLNISDADRKRRSEQITAINRTLNNQPEKIAKSRATKSLRNGGYTKYYGRHEHRVVAEKMLGRTLLPWEVVHHLDGDKSNNAPENLQVMSQSEHITLHLAKGGGHLVSSVSAPKTGSRVSATE